MDITFKIKDLENENDGLEITAEKDWVSIKVKGTYPEKTITIKRDEFKRLSNALEYFDPLDGPINQMKSQSQEYKSVNFD